MNLVQRAYRRRQGLADSARRHQSRGFQAMASHTVRLLVIATAIVRFPIAPARSNRRRMRSPSSLGRTF